jgi:hypothetical protein
MHAHKNDAVSAVRTTRRETAASAQARSYADAAYEEMWRTGLTWADIEHAAALALAYVDAGTYDDELDGDERAAVIDALSAMAGQYSAADLLPAVCDAIVAAAIDGDPSMADELDADACERLCGELEDIYVALRNATDDRMEMDRALLRATRAACNLRDEHLDAIEGGLEGAVADLDAGMDIDRACGLADGLGDGAVGRLAAELVRCEVRECADVCIVLPRPLRGTCVADASPALRIALREAGESVGARYDSATERWEYVPDSQRDLYERVRGETVVMVVEAY